MEASRNVGGNQSEIATASKRSDEVALEQEKNYEGGGKRADDR